MTHHDQIADTVARVQTPVVDVFPVRPENGQDDYEGEEYLVDIDTHQTVLVRATTPETAIAKAVLHTIEPEEDGAVTEVARDVHTCIHTGMDDEDHVGHEAEE